MTSSLAASPRSGLLGAQEPRICWVPEYATTIGDEAADFVAQAGLVLDPWQAFVLRHSLGTRPDGKWAAFEVGACVPRQNGKGGILEARELTGLYLLNEELITHSAHMFDTSLEAFRRLRGVIEGRDELSRRVKRFINSHGEEGIELHGPPGRRRTGGQRVRFRTRTKGGGRGFSGDTLIFDEDMILPESTLGALFFTLSARPNPQLWYTGSAVDQEVHEDGIVKARLRDRALKGGDPSLMYVEWSLDVESPDDVDDELATDPEAWAQTNPGLGIRISLEHVAKEQRSIAARTFAVERLNVGDWPDLDPGAEDRKLDPEAFAALKDEASTIAGPVVFAFDVRPDRSYSSIGVAGKRADALGHVEVVDRRAGTRWVVDRLIELTKKHEAAKVLCDGKSPAASLLKECDSKGLTVEVVDAQEYAQACGRFVDAVNAEALRHLGTQELQAAVAGLTTRPLGDAWAWSRKSSKVDISPLVVVTLALWGAEGTTVEPLFGFA